MILNCIFSILSILLYINAPLDYNLSFIIFLSLAFITQSSLFVLLKGKGNYLNFYAIFFVGYFFVNFFYPLILYPINQEYFSVFTLGFNREVINKSTALAFLCSSFMILGASVNTKKFYKKNNQFIYYHNNLTKLTFLFVVIFFITVGRDYLSGNFTAQTSLSLYVLLILNSLIIISTIVFFRDYYYQTNKSLYYLTLFFYLMIFLLVGDRGPALTILILAFVLYSKYVKQLNIIYILPITILGVFIMHIIGEGRSVEVDVGAGNIFSRGMADFDFDENSFYNITHGFVVNSITLYYGVDYVDKYDINFGLTFIKSIVSVFPFLQGLLESAFDIKLKTSSEFFTDEIIGENASWGIGTNLISDIYISFGLGGCIILFYFLGYLIERFRLNAENTNSIKACIIYFSLVGLALYYSRTGIFIPLRVIIWSLFLFYLLRSMNILKVRDIDFNER